MDIVNVHNTPQPVTMWPGVALLMDPRLLGRFHTSINVTSVVNNHIIKRSDVYL